VPIMSCCRRIVVTRCPCSKPGLATYVAEAESKFDPSVVAAYL
jgi:hypothetical protein